MNIGIFINTPPQAHFYKNIIYNLEKKGHKIKDKEHLLLTAFGAGFTWASAILKNNLEE